MPPKIILSERDDKTQTDNKNQNKEDTDTEHRLDEELDDTFPASDVPSFTQPGADRDPIPASKKTDR